MDPKIYPPLLTVFADVYVYSQTALGFHWNVTGRNFYSDHQLFGLIYTESYAQIDRLAEHIRSLGSRSPSTLASILELSHLPEVSASISSDAMLKSLVANTLVLEADILECFTISSSLETSGGEATAQICSELLELFGKFKYLLTSTLS